MLLPFNCDSAPGPGTSRRPLGLKWRSSFHFITYVIGLGVTIDMIVYSIIIPVVPFQLEHLGYTGISALSGWLIFAFSGGLVVATIPVALWSECYKARKYPLIGGLLFLIGSQIMFMEAPSFAVMCIARVIQGASSSVVWVVGLAFLCDATPREIIGRQIGFVMSGFSLGLILGQPLGGLLYTRFGFRGPFIFSLICTFVDLVSRFVVIEPSDAKKWGVDPTILSKPKPSNGNINLEAERGTINLASEPQSGIEIQEDATRPSQGARVSSQGNFLSESKGTVDEVEVSLSLLQVLFRLSKSPRALVALGIVFVYGFIYSSQEPGLPLHLQSAWGLSSKDVGVLLLALSVPIFFSSLLTGWLTDIVGAQWVATISTILAIPWWGVITINGSLPLFGVAFALENFFTWGSVSPITVELATVSEDIQGVGYAHMYGAYNIAYGIGTTVGSIVGGQMYDHIEKGWFAISILGAAMLFTGLVLIILYTGDRPLLSKLIFSRLRSALR